MAQRQGEPDMRTLRDIDVADARVLVRADFNVPIENGRIRDDTRIQETLPTIRALREQGAKVILCAHLGRPEGKPVKELRLDPVARRLSELLNRNVGKVDDCVGKGAESAIENMMAGDVILLENTRFHAEEETNDEEFARQLAGLADFYVNDAFGAAHRAHASTEGVAHHLPSAAGLLMEREIEALSAVRDDPEHPFVAILGGAKISDKIGVIERLLETVDHLLVGGGMANTFLMAQGLEVGNSLVDDESLLEARRLAEKAGDRLVLPVDAVIASELDSSAHRETVSVGRVSEGKRILDVGPDTLALFRNTLVDARTVLWNGPLGAFEVEPFAEGTYAMARALSSLDATTVVGGGETVTALARTGLKDRMTHVSTGGGAFLEFMEGKELPGVRALEGGAVHTG
jgi:phosphoglycerate kinase